MKTKEPKISKKLLQNPASRRVNWASSIAVSTCIRMSNYCQENMLNGSRVVEKLMLKYLDRVAPLNKKKTKPAAPKKQVKKFAHPVELQEKRNYLMELSK